MMFRKSLYTKLFLLSFLFFTNSCNEDEGPIEVVVTSKLVVSPENLNFEESDTGNFFLSVQPKGEFEWNISSKPEWAAVNPSSGTINNDLIEIEVQSNSEGLTPNVYNGVIELVSNGAGKITVDVQLIVETPDVETPSISLLTVSKDELEFDFSENDKDFFVKNEGGVDFDWVIENSNADLTLIPESGSIMAGDSTKVSVSVNRTTLNTQIYEWPIVISNNKNDTINLPIVINSYQEEKWQLPSGEIVDAEYDRNFDRIVAVSVLPNQIRKYDPVSKTTETIDLSLPPTCVSISQDGKYAAVGHDGKISYVNLSTMEVLEIMDVTTDVYDIVLAPNNWVYAFPRADQWENIRCINLETKAETLHTGGSIYAKTKAKLHPSGDYIYGANTGLSPSDFEKYDITNGTARYLYDSPYHGDFSFDGNIWISENGEKLFARSRNVFNASILQSTDMTYNGKLLGEDQESIATMDHHAESNIIFAVFEAGYTWENNPSSVVRKYSADFYNFQEEEELPKFLGTDLSGKEKLIDAQGYFGFFNAAGTEYYVVVRSVEDNNASIRWAIATISAD